MKKDEKRKRDAERRKRWYHALPPEKREEIKYKMRKYFQVNKERLIAKQRERRAIKRTAEAQRENQGG